MKTLFITFTYLKGNRGAIYASRTHINLFAALSEKMTLLYPYKTGMEPEGINMDKIKMIPVEDFRSRLKKLIDLCMGKRHRFIGFAEKYANPDLYDTVVFDSSLVSSRMIDVFIQAGIRPITIHHNYEIEYIKGDGNIFTKFPSLFWTNIQEGKAVRKSCLNLTLTEQDAKLLRLHYSSDAKIVTLGVFDYQEREYVMLENRLRGHHYLITGGLGSKQNEDSLLPWLERYYPIIKRIDSEAHLTLAGRSPSKALIDAALNVGAVVISSPEDMAPILASGDFYVCPTDRGGGLKLRIMDGLKAGMPVLTHEVSARGYEWFIKSGIVYSYHDEKTFEQSLRAMLSNKKSFSEIQQNYIDRFSFNNGVRILNDILVNNNFL